MIVRIRCPLPQTSCDNWIYARVYAFSSHFIAPGIHSDTKDYSVMLGQPITGLVSASRGKYGTCILRPTIHLGTPHHKKKPSARNKEQGICAPHLEAWPVLSYGEFNLVSPSDDLYFDRGILDTLDLDGWAFYNAPSLAENG